MKRKNPKQHLEPADRPDIEFKVACDVIESVKFGDIYGFYAQL